jgi:hypothetical protein
MAVFLAFGFAFLGRADGFGGGPQCGIDHVGGRLWAVVAGVHQLNSSTHCG